ncbi:MFS-type transporter-like protein 6 [Elsinoe fawcettii]|nr:MFS-type transporter-like protein 6 [Elsinoe fawcettii]
MSLNNDKDIEAKKSHVEDLKDVVADEHLATDEHGRATVSFDPKAEAKLRLKLDLYLIPTVALLYLFCFIDRANIGNARLAGFERDLGLQGYDYNTVLSIFYVSYIVFELPSNACCKWIGPGWFLPAITLGFGLCSIFTAFVNNLRQACAVRFFLGAFEAGALPRIAYYLSRWYRRSELTFRLAMYFVMAPLAGGFGGLLASAILTLDNFGSLRSWRMIFAIEGIVTVILALVSFLTLTDRPETARWLTAEEKELAIARVKSERVGTTEVLDKMDKTKLLRGVANPITIAWSFIFLLVNITVQGLAFFTPTVVRTIYPRSPVVQQQLYTVPPYMVGAFFTLFFCYISWKKDTRQLVSAAAIVFAVAGYVIFVATTNSRARYGGLFLATSCFVLGPTSNAQVSANVVSDTARSSAIGTIVMFGNIGGLIATWSFLPFDAPNYYIGNGLNLATTSCIFISCIALHFWMIWDNKKRDRKDVEQALSGMTMKEVQGLDWKHPGFRWRP